MASHSKLPDPDWVVVGGGSAGAIVAERLSSRRELRVQVAHGRSGRGAGQRLARVSVCLHKPGSRGVVRLRSPDAADEQRLVRAVERLVTELSGPGLATVVAAAGPDGDGMPRDGCLRRGLQGALLALAGRGLDGPRWLRELLLAQAFARGGRLPGPPAGAGRLASFVQAHAHAGGAAAGTCRMGDPGDPYAVTAPNGRVFGVEGLWVADASLMPSIPSVGTARPAAMVAEKVADGLLARYPR
ncbi:GMC oxidoreductase [Pseudorhodoferax sp.]|uniref:GMC oxidoreductase n=1 Tax=Pseudorhodoferax sp. TaxID=1993553 RepID=UPI002DD635BE|nr:GMC oxidoreductase [Pseudorhodoferax sp.]